MVRAAEAGPLVPESGGHKCPGDGLVAGSTAPRQLTENHYDPLPSVPPPPPPPLLYHEELCQIYASQ